jgi:hypothetical protein
VAAGAKLDLPATAKINVGNGGTYRIEGGGTNEGTITIATGGIAIGKGAGLSGNGYTVAEDGAIAVIELPSGVQIPQIANADSLAAYSGMNPIIKLTGGSGTKLSFNDKGFVLEGAATFNGIPGSGSFQVGYTADADSPNNRILTLKSNTVLTITGTQTQPKNLVVVVSDDGPGILGETGAQIVLSNSYSFIEFYVYGDSSYHSTISSLNHNFYNISNIKEASNVLKGVGASSARTYAWDLNADGANTAGWLAQQ